jgi:hypothetical protein
MRPFGPSKTSTIILNNTENSWEYSQPPKSRQTPPRLSGQQTGAIHSQRHIRRRALPHNRTQQRLES